MNRNVWVVIVLCLISSVLYAQKQPVQPLSKTAIEIGDVKLRLGMTKAQVAQKLLGQGITKPGPGDDEWWLGTLDDIKAGRDLPALQFAHGVLTFAQRRWNTPDNDSVEALFGLVTHLNEEGLSKCTVTAGTHTNTDISVIWQKVWITCGEKTALLTRLTKGENSSSSVYEQLGQFRDMGQ